MGEIKGSSHVKCHIWLHQICALPDRHPHVLDDNTLKVDKLTVLAAAVALSVGLSACGGGGSSPTAMPEPTSSAYDVAVTAIAAAGTEEDARAAVATAMAAGISGAQLQSLNMAVATRVMALAAMAAAEERKMLVEAAMCEDATAACVDDHDALIAALEKDLADLQASDDATNAEEQAARMAVADAKEARNAVQTQLTEIDRSTATGSAVGAAVDAANGLADMRTPEDIAAAEMLLATARGMLTQADDYDEQIAMAQMAIDRAKARNAVDMAVMGAEKYSAMLTDDQSEAAVMKARMEVDAAKQAVMDNAEALNDADETGFNARIALAEAPIGPLESQIASMKTEEQRKADAAMAVTATKLFAGISMPMGDIRTGSGFAVDDRTAAYNVINDSGDPVGGVPANSAVDTLIMVSIGDGGDTAHTAAVPLTEDKKAMVAKLHGWEGKRYTAEPDGDGMYEAMVYSNVGEPTPGKKFGSAEAGEVGGDQEYRYLLTAADVANPGEVALDQTGALHTTSKVTAIPSFDLTAGTKEYPLQTNRERVMIPGSYHGVPGNYYCVAGTAATCAVRLAEDGFRLGETADAGNAFTQTGADAVGGTWTFKPTDRNARVMGTPDAIYASYGWWIHKSEDGNTFTASAFVDNKGEVPRATGLADLQGTATYMGGAAGKYALSSSTGGTNDAGHFTARATLNADFSDNTITGTIDNFMGADGMDRDWSVELKEAAIDTGGTATTHGDFARAADDDTVWTLGGTAAAASGEWSGTLYNTAVTETDTSGVPKVGTGTFYTMYGSSGKMVGAFGVNRQ